MRRRKVLMSGRTLYLRDVQGILTTTSSDYTDSAYELLEVQRTHRKKIAIFAFLVICFTLIGCQRQANVIRLEKHAQVLPSPERNGLFVVEPGQLRFVGPHGQVRNITSYSPKLQFDLPLFFICGRTRCYLATEDRVFYMGLNPPKIAFTARIDPWADSSLAVSGSEQLISYIGRDSTVVVNGKVIPVRNANGVYSDAFSERVYVATDTEVAVYDVKSGRRDRKLDLQSPRDILSANHGNDVVITFDTNKLSIYNRTLTKSRFDVEFPIDCAVWAADLNKNYLAVVTWEGAAFSARWVARFYDLATKKEIKSVDFKEPTKCFVMDGNRVAIVSDEGIKWESW